MKEKIITEQSSSINKELFLHTYMSYISLSKYLFGKGEEGVYNVNEILKSCKFYKPAKEIAKSLGIDWKNMTHEESNRIMLALLEDFYNAMSEVADKDNLFIEVKLKVIKNK